MHNQTDLLTVTRLRESVPPGFGLSPEDKTERCGNCSAFDAAADVCSRFDYPATAGNWCERWTPARVREGSYGLPGGQQMYFEDGDTYKDITDLYTVVPMKLDNDTPNLENEQLQTMARDYITGRALSLIQIGVLKRLLDKYSDDLAALRSSPDRDGQDYSHAPDPATARLIGET